MSVFRFIKQIAEGQPITGFIDGQQHARFHLRRRYRPRHHRGPQTVGIRNYQPGGRPADDLEKM